MTFNENIRLENLTYLEGAMEKLKLSQVGLGDKLGVSEGRISQWMAGSPIPKKRKAQIDSLLMGNASPQMTKVERSIPYPAPSGIPLPVFTNFPDNDDFSREEDKIDQLVLSPWFLGGNWSDCYIVRVKESIEFNIDNGDHIIVKPKRVFKPGDLVVVKLGSYCKVEKVPEAQPPLGMNIKGVVIKILKDL
jgi:SOS-response transcriptional repressor LexA